MRYSEKMKFWLFDLAHGNLSELEIIKGFIKYYVLYNQTIQNVQDDIHFHTTYGVLGEQMALESLNKALCSYVNYEKEWYYDRIYQSKRSLWIAAVFFCDGLPDHSRCV